MFSRTGEVIIGSGICLIIATGLVIWWRETRPGPDQFRGLRRCDLWQVYGGMSLIEKPFPLPKSTGLGWRVDHAVYFPSFPLEILPPYPFPSWRELLGTPFDKRAGLFVSRRDGSATVLAIRGPDTILEIGFEHLSELPDGMILTMESNDRDIHWMSDENFELRDLERDTGRKPGSEWPEGFYVIFADGQIWYLSKDVPTSSLATLATRHGAAANDRENVLWGHVLERDEARR